MSVQSPTKPQFLSEEMVENQVAPPPKTIFDAIPLGLVMKLAAPYLAGESPDAAIQLAHDIYKSNHFCSTLDILGEDCTTEEDCDGNVAAYHDLVDRAVAHKLSVHEPRQQMTISMKPSMFSTLPPSNSRASQTALEKAFDRITRVVEYAFKNNIAMTLEAEDHRWTNFQLESYFALISAGYTNLGTVLQTRLFRTEKDVARFDERMRVRLVIGIYNEPTQIAHTDKRTMKDLVVQYAGQLLNNGCYTELATHDQKCIENFYNWVAAPHAVPVNRFEHQFLLGVPRNKVQRGLVSGEYFSALAASRNGKESEYLRDIATKGALVRMYLPYGTAAVSGAYCRRRLRENPNMITYGIKNVLGIQ